MDQRYTLVNNDCMKELDTIEPNSVQMILTDVPYELSKTKCIGSTRLNFGPRIGYDYTTENDTTINWVEWITKCKRVLKKNGVFNIFLGTKQLRDFFDAFDEVYGPDSYNYRIVIWDKVNVNAQNSFQWFTSNLEYMLAIKFYKQKDWGDLNNIWNHNKQTITSLYREPHPLVVNKHNWQHPHTKPQNMLRDLIRLQTNKDDIVLDPFMGGGSIGVATLLEDRKFYGIEQQEKWYNESIKQISKTEVLLTSRLF